MILTHRLYVSVYSHTVQGASSHGMVCISCYGLSRLYLLYIPYRALSAIVCSIYTTHTYFTSGTYILFTPEGIAVQIYLIYKLHGTYRKHSIYLDCFRPRSIYFFPLRLCHTGKTVTVQTSIPALSVARPTSGTFQGNFLLPFPVLSYRLHPDYTTHFRFCQ